MSFKKHKQLTTMFLLFCALTTFYLCWFFLSANMTQPSTGIEKDSNGNLRLVDCPSTPNCVCSMDADLSHQINAIPIHHYDNPADPWNDFLKTIEESKGFSTFLSKTTNSCHAVFKTSIMRFPDDFFAIIDHENKVIHIRSSSRIGISDLGKNKKRVDLISNAFQKINE